MTPEDGVNFILPFKICSAKQTKFFNFDLTKTNLTGQILAFCRPNFESSRARKKQTGLFYNI